MEKVFLRVTAEHDLNGSMIPRSIRWNDGRVFTVDKVFDVRQAPSLKCGGLGLRFSCMIHGRPYYLFYDEGRWFAERVTADDRPLREKEAW